MSGRALRALLGELQSPFFCSVLPLAAAMGRAIAAVAWSWLPQSTYGLLRAYMGGSRFS